MDDSNLSVVTACAKALHALLSCSANEAIFGLQEVLSLLHALVGLCLLRYFYDTSDLSAAVYGERRSGT